MPEESLSGPIAIADKLKEVNSLVADCCMGILAVIHSSSPDITEAQMSSLNTNLELAKTYMSKVRSDLSWMLMQEVTRRLTKED